jgi:transketolase
VDRSVYPPADNLTLGGYILRDVQDGIPDLILIGTGSEVHIALEAAKILDEKGVGARVVAMPSWELFDRQDEAYRRRVLPPEIKPRIAIEAGISQGWHRYVGDMGRVIGLDRFGASAPSKILFEKFGFTSDHLVKTALTLLQRPGHQ